MLPAYANNKPTGKAVPVAAALTDKSESGAGDV